MNLSVNKVRGIAQSEKDIMIYHKQKGKIYTYSKNGHGQISNDEFKEIRSKPCSGTFLMVPKGDKDDTMKITYDRFMKEATLIRDKTDGLINMFKTGRPANTALNFFFNEISKSVLGDTDLFSEKIGSKEAEFIEQASTGALIWSERNFKGEAYDYDVISHYPAILNSKGTFKIPIKAGEFLTLTKEEFDNKDFYGYGIYKAVITPKDDSYFKLMRLNPKHNKYTHIDLMRAKSLGHKIELICDGQPNFLSYDRTKCVASSQLFSTYVETLYILKQEGITYAKEILNCIWGALCQTKEKTFMRDMSKKEEVFDIYNEMIEITPINDSKWKVVMVNTEDRYAYGYARMKPFLLAKGREKISKIIEKDIDNIKRVHTDGFVATKKLDIKLGEKMGELKYKGYCGEYNIIATNDVKGKFDPKL